MSEIKISKEIEIKARQIADSLGISVFVRDDGTFHQRGPGREIRPTKDLKKMPHGEGKIPPIEEIIK